MPDGWLCRMALTLIRPTGAICLGLGLPDGGYALSGLRVRYAGVLVVPDGACAYPAYGCDMPGVLVLPDGGCALSGLRVRYACGMVMPDGGCALSGLRVRYAWGFWLCRMAAAPYPAYGCDMLGFWFAGWRLRLIRPTGAICLRFWFWFCRMVAMPYPAYGHEAAETA